MMQFTSDVGHLTASEREDFAVAYKSGELQSGLGERFGLTAKGVRHLIAELGLPARPRTRPGTKRRSIPDGVISEMLIDYESGVSVEVLQAKYELPVSRIYAGLRAAGRSLRRRSANAIDKLPTDLLDTIIVMNRDQGIACKRIAEILDLPRHSVETAVRQLIPRPRRAILSGEEQTTLQERVLQLYVGSDSTIKQIAEELSVGISTVTRLVQTLDIPKRGTSKGRRRKPPI